MGQVHPELEGGYTKIANFVIGALSQCPFTGSEYRILLTIARKTYGWQKNETFISYSNLSILTRIDIRYVKRIVKRLIQEKVLIRKSCSNRNGYCINTNYRLWSLWITSSTDTPKDTTRGV